jgi:beta-galactosidase
MSSPGYLTATPGNSSNVTYSDTTDITVTPLHGNTTDDTSFFVVRHSEYTSLAKTSYKVTFPTSQGNITIPLTGESLSLNGRDSKVMVTDYDVQGTRLLYSTADIFTHQKYNDRIILIMHAGATEYNEFAIRGSSNDVKELEKGGNYTLAAGNSSNFVTVGWVASSDRTILQIGGVKVYLLGKLASRFEPRTANST